MSKCEICGAKYNKNGVCPECGYVKPEGVSLEPKGAKAFSIVSLATGIAAFVYGVYFAIAALIFAAIYKNKVGEYNSMAKIGKTLGIVNIVIAAVTTVISAVMSIFSIILVVVGNIALIVLPYILN